MENALHWKKDGLKKSKHVQPVNEREVWHFAAKAAAACCTVVHKTVFLKVALLLHFFGASGVK